MKDLASIPMSRGVERTDDSAGLPASLLDAISAAGGLWSAGDYYAPAELIVRTAQDNGVRALRIDARDLSWITALPDLEFLHVRTDGRPSLDPIQHLLRLRGLTIETGALRGMLDLAAHPDLEWLKLKLSGKGGAANLPGVMAGHPMIRHLQLSEVPFTELSGVAAAFPSVRFLGLFGADRLARLGDLGPWRDTLAGFSATFAMRLRSLEGLDRLDRIESVGLEFGTIDGLGPLAGRESLRYLQVTAAYPTLGPLTGHRGIRMATLAMPADGDLAPLRTWPSLAAMGGSQWIGHPIEGLPMLEELARDDDLRVEWRRAVHG